MPRRRHAPSMHRCSGPDVRVVLVHDWLTGMRGGEKVLASLCRLYPKADLLTLVHARGAVSPQIEARRVRTAFIQHLPSPTRWYRHYLPLFPTAIEQFDLDDVDLVVSTSHCAAKAVVPTGRAVHVCYCHSPMRYAWDQFDHYFGIDRVGRWGEAAARHVLAAMARWDRETAGRVTRYLANSAHVAGRIARYYNRDATVLHPPVDTEFFVPGTAPSDAYFLVVSALVPYKRIDIAIRAAARLGAPLKIVGTGPDTERLRALAGPTVEFLGHVDDATLRTLYQRAHATLLPGEEDFGIAPVEAQACGSPVIALGRGGALETVVHGVTGYLVADESPEAFADAMAAVSHLPSTPADRQQHAGQFSIPAFEAGLRARIDATLERPSGW